ncbi:ribonuclease D [Aestuariivirga sp.]|uniref:ribonuclease D n=1 Tax=Aestuariivirga sp. TaxID=2650926 RepID=UPI0039E5A588
MITTTESLARLCEGLKGETFITVDTEFMRESTYWPDLCLIQIAGETLTGLIDPMAPGIDLAPFFALMNDPKVLKVFHAARQDIEIMVHRSGVVPHPVFDTQIAAMVCGFGDQVGYEAIVRRLAKVQIDKSSRFTDWSRRPLTEKQLVYALSDVTHLRTVYEKLKTELDKTGREPWLVEEMDILANPATYRTEPEDAWKRIKVRIKSKKQLGVLVAVSAWRESEAQERNVPRSRIIKDDAVGEIATQIPQSRESLSELRALPRGLATSRVGDGILKAVAQGLAMDAKSLPPLEHGRDEMSDQAQAAAEILKLALKVVCEKEGLAPKLVANAADIEAIAEDDNADIPLMHGWRKELFGDLALALKHGEALIGFKNGKTQIVRLEKPALTVAAE